MRMATLALAVAVITHSVGCGYVINSCRSVAVRAKHEWSAEKAWRARKWMFGDLPCKGSFKSGFKAGYRFANGGYDSCESPVPKHYWRIAGITESEADSARAWSDGFTHGTVAAQQDHAVGPSAWDAAAMQPPPGVPDVNYYNPPPANPMDQNQNIEMAPPPPPPVPPNPNQSGQFQPGQFQPGLSYEGSLPTGPAYPPYVQNSGNESFQFNGQEFQYSPNMYSPGPYSEGMYSPGGYSPGGYSSGGYSSNIYSPNVYSPSVPPPAPGAESDVALGNPSAQANGRLLAGPMPVTGAAQGTRNMNPPMVRQPAAAPAPITGESVPAGSLPVPPSPQSIPMGRTPGNDWQLPVIGGAN